MVSGGFLIIKNVLMNSWSLIWIYWIINVVECPSGKHHSSVLLHSSLFLLSKFLNCSCSLPVGSIHSFWHRVLLSNKLLLLSIDSFHCLEGSWIVHTMVFFSEHGYGWHLMPHIKLFLLIFFHPP